MYEYLQTTFSANHGIKRHPPYKAKCSVDGNLITYSHRGSYGSKLIFASGLASLLVGLFLRFDPFFGFNILASHGAWAFIIIGAIVTTIGVIHSRTTDRLTIDIRRKYLTWSRTSFLGINARELPLHRASLRIHPCKLARLTYKRTLIGAYWHGHALCLVADDHVWMVLAVDKTPEACLAVLRQGSLDLTHLAKGMGPTLKGNYLGAMY